MHMAHGSWSAMADKTPARAKNAISRPSPQSLTLLSKSNMLALHTWSLTWSLEPRLPLSQSDPLVTHTAAAHAALSLARGGAPERWWREGAARPGF